MTTKQKIIIVSVIIGIMFIAIFILVKYKLVTISVLFSVVILLIDKNVYSLNHFHLKNK